MTAARRSTLTARIATIQMNLSHDPHARHADIWRANLAAARRELRGN